MKKNASQPQFKGLNTLNITLQSPNNQQKKIQGFDLTSTTKSTAYVNKIQQLKNKPNKQSIEDQYIKGLQDEIHYLQMELKLLQQKDQAKHSHIDQLQKFFSDGVPINQNILAIKNGFNNYKNEKQKTIKELLNEKKERETLIDELTKRIKQMQKSLENEQKDIRDLSNTNQNYLHTLVKSEAKIKKEIQLEDEELKNIKLQNRKLGQKLSSLQRNKEIQTVMVLRNQNHKLDKLKKIKESITQKEVQFQDLEKQYEQLLKQQQQKSYVIKIEEENLTLKKKAISMERELNAIQTKSQQKQIQLDAKLKDRYKEISAREQMKMRLETEKARITKENSTKVQDIEKVARQKEISFLQKIITKNKKLSKYTEYYGQILSKVEDEIQKMVQKKPELKSQINAFTAEVKIFLETLHQEKARQSELFSQIVETEQKIEYFSAINPSLIESSQKTQEQIGIYKSEKEKLVEDIKIKEKQLELILILRSLNLQEVQMSNSSSSNIQDKLIRFIRSWQQLQRNS